MAQNPQAVIPDNIIIVDGEINPVPTPAAGDSGKVLTVVDAEGTIGWSPVSSSGTQLQADWTETDNTSVQYIAHKPDLSVYATSSDVTTALSGKQDTISDLSDIRSGAEAGATAVQPAALNDYVLSSSLATVATTGVYSDLSGTPTIPSGDALVPSASSGDAGKVLTVNAQGSTEWVTPSGGTTYSAGDGIAIDGNNVVSADVDGTTIGIDSTSKKIKLLSSIPTVDQTYNASSTNAQSGTAVASAVSNAVSGLDEVPTVTSSDNGKVLKAVYSGGQGSYAWDTDSNTTYTAGNMIAINANNSNAIGVSTTAGITDIQTVNVLPANPVSTVLYLIPAT